MHVMCSTGWRRINLVVQILYFYNKTRKYDNVRVAPSTLVKAVLNVSSSNACSNERQSFVKLSYSVIDNVLTNLLPTCLQDFFQVLNVSNAMTIVNKLLECSPDQIVHCLLICLCATSVKGTILCKFS